MKCIIAILGLLVVFGLAFLISNDKRHIRYRPLSIMVVLQLILGFILLNTGIGEYLVKGIASTFEALRQLRLQELQAHQRISR